MLKPIRVIAALALFTPCLAQTAHHTRTKKQWVLSAIVLVAANVLDARSSTGQQELNPLLRNSRGQFSAGRAIAMKSIGIGSVLAVEALIIRNRPELARTSSIVNFVSAGAVTATAINNTRHLLEH